MNHFIIMSLSMLMNDPYYCTLKGFKILIEHVWIRFGYPFAKFCGYTTLDQPVSSASDSISIFIQFIDCIFQLYSQFICSFEFNEYYLIFILDCLFNGRFGTFLSNNEKQFREIQLLTVPVWVYIENHIDEFKNKYYEPDNKLFPLQPDTTSSKICFWSGYFLSSISINGIYYA